VNWVKRGALPRVSFIDNNGVRYFDQERLKKAREIVKIRKANVGQKRGGGKDEIASAVYEMFR
jgi:hypothetical protein